MYNKGSLLVMFAVPYQCDAYSRLCLKQTSDFDLHTCERCAEIALKKYSAGCEILQIRLGFG